MGKRLIDYDELKLKVMDAAFPFPDEDIIFALMDGTVVDFAGALCRWIPCEERMPEKCGKYLAAVDSEAFRGANYIDVLQYDEIGWRDGCCYVNGVNCWMELPELPELPEV